jgi:excinuclease ABC subunit C
MPDKPGSYQYYDKDGAIIYVGKAKSLKKRVSSYFHKEVDRYKTKVLVSKIHDITYTVVNTEEDALLLENSLIKKYNPRYNVLLKDGKTYPSICITNEPFPRIFKTRTINRKYGTYYGPYSHLGSMYAVLDLIKKLLKPRTCRLPLSKESIENGKFKPCLEYHMKNCGAPCIGKQSMKDYRESIMQAREILKGNTRILIEHIYGEMMKASEEMRFEDAEELKKKYQLIEQFCAKSEVVSHTITDVDVFAMDASDDTSFINYMHVTNGTINQSFTYEYKRKIDDSDEDLLLTAIIEIRERFHSTAKEIIVPIELDWQMENTTFFVPQRGDKHHLLELSLMNCKQYRIDRLKQTDKLNPEQKYTRLMKELQEKLQLDKLPYRIELFDNSNISGSDAVAGCVVYKGMKPSKKDYRKYNIKTVIGPDDYASMQEVVRRRYTDSDEMPDLIICDGGIGQMHCVQEVVAGELGLNIPIAGLAKNDKHRTQELLYLKPNVSRETLCNNPSFSPLDYDCVTVQLKPESELFRVLTQMQDEVHRFAITFHRDKRSKHALHSELDDIKGIGPKAKDALLKTFKSVKKLRETANSEDGKREIISVLGNSKGNIIIEYFKEEKGL